MYRADENDPWHYIWIVFTGLSVPSYLRACGLTRNNPVFRPKSYAHAVSSRVREPLRQILGRPDASKAFIIGQLHLFFDGLMENTAVQSKNVTTDINIANVYIAEAMRIFARWMKSPVSAMLPEAIWQGCFAARCMSHCRNI